MIDDTHHLREPATVTSLAMFLQHLPTWLHVVIAGRTNPAIPLDRLRVRGQVAEVRYEDLRLTPEETHDVLVRLVPGLSEEAIGASVEQTDGWAAGVQLTGLAVARRAGAAVHRRDVGLPPALRGLRVARGAGQRRPRCRRRAHERVGGRPGQPIAGDGDHRTRDARRMLVSGEAQGLFVHRLGADDWFRIHPLVREALYASLAPNGSSSAAPWARRPVVRGRRGDGQCARPVVARRPTPRGASSARRALDRAVRPRS